MEGHILDQTAALSVLPEALKCNDANVLISGGARGADTCFEKAATAAGFKVVHWVVDADGSVNNNDVHRVNPPNAMLQMTEVHIRNASKAIHRSVPKRPYVLSLIQRNVFQAYSCTTMYAVGWFQPDSASLLAVEGGTAWTCQLYVDRFRTCESLCKLYFFELRKEKWFMWDVQHSEWKAMTAQPPSPSGHFAGIGSRKITPTGVKAVQSLFSASIKRRAESKDIESSAKRMKRD